MAKVNTKALAVRHVASRDPGRSVLLESDGSLVATDGHMMLMACHAEREAGKRALFSLEAVERAVKVAKRDKVSEAELEPSTDECQQPENFPNYGAVRPEIQDAKFSITLDGRLLERVIKAAVEFHGLKPKDPVAMTLHFTDALSAVLVLTGSDAGEFEAVVMPMRP